MSDKSSAVLTRAAVLGLICGGSLGVGEAVGADIAPSPAMMRYPAVSESKIAFVYGNAVWTAPRSGGTATPVASPPGQTSFPKFSPDGSHLSFVGNYDGNREIYVVPVTGGIPTRVTHFPGNEALAQWTQDNRLLYMMPGLAGLGRMSQLFLVSPQGGMPEKLPMPYAGFGALSGDGEWVAFTPHTTDTRTWKRYRGGMATDIWLLNLKDRTTKKITDWEGTDTLPMFGYGRDAGKTVYYLSDSGPEHRLNVWSYEISGGERKQITNFADDDVRWPSIGPGAAEDRGRGEIVFQLGSQLMLLDLSTKQSRAVKITIPGILPKIKSRFEDAGENITDSALSPSGKRVVLTARGDVWSVPAKEGPARNLTHTPGVFERSATWSPDGRWLAYFSDQSGEYELWVRPSDARPPAPKDKEGEDAKAEKSDEPKAAETPEPNPGPREAVKLTDLGPGFRRGMAWSPDSKHVVFSDHIGQITLATIKVEGATMTAEVKKIDKDPWSEDVTVSWSHDSNWIVYTKADEGSGNTCLWLYNLTNGEKNRITSPMFASTSPTFDRKGEVLYYVSGSEWNNPKYGDADQSFIYAGTQRINMMPLRKDVASPLPLKSDEEELKVEKKDEKKDDKAKGEKKDKPAEKKDATDDGVSGTWSGTAMNVPGVEGPLAFTLTIRIDDKGAVTGTITAVMGSGTVTGTFDKASGAISISYSVGGADGTIRGTIKDKELTGTWSSGQSGGDAKATRTAAATGDDEKAAAEKKEKEAAKDKKPLKIDIDGLERRAVRLPIGAGNYGQLGVTHDGKLLYVWGPSRGNGGGAQIKIFDPKDDTREEKTVAGDAGGFDITADGKKLLIRRGDRFQLIEAQAGGGKAQDVNTRGLRVEIDPRVEWKQIFNDAWRLQRDYFYVENMHGVDWAKLREHYGRMVDEAASREDVQFIIGELISELNIGHAYVQAPGDIDDTSTNVGVGMLGCDFSLTKGDKSSGFKITRVCEGAPWDADARSPLTQAVNPTTGKAVHVGVGDYIVAVNGVPVNPAKDVWAAFVGLADKPVVLTIADKPSLDEAGVQSREALVRTIGNEGGLRFRDWIERNRKYVEEKSGGKLGYIYVPDTGVNGQNELFRQFFGQTDRPGLVIDERWNGGGQIPTRFIELLNRPATNYWARRGLHDWTWPPDSAQGVKCMLINGLAGSGGDMFPWLFRANKLGKLIGMRTWGGLVGISGNPGFIDGGSMTVPTFGFYKKDGTWGVEGHGTDPDIMVIDDPALMLDPQAGADGQVRDPQLDAAIAHMLEEIGRNPYAAPQRPADPDRRGIGIPEKDR